MSMNWVGRILHLEEETMSKATSSDVAQLFESAWAAFTTARRQSQTAQSVFLTVGGSVIRLLFANDALPPLFLPALAHLALPTREEAAIEIAIWDSASTGVSMLPPPWAEDDYLARGEIRGVDATAAVQVAYHPGSGILSMLHRDEQRAVVWMADAEQCPSYERAAPLRTILHWWCTAQGQQLVHGAAIGTEEGAVLITGKGGSGKSTTALSALQAGMFYLGDDYVLCELSAGTAQVFSVFNSAKVDSNTLRRLALSAAQLINRDSFLAQTQNSSEPEKGVLLVQEYRPALVRESLPLRAVLAPQITDHQEARLQPLKPAQAFLALTPTTVFQLPGTQQAALSFLRRLVTQLPCYQLELGRNPAQTHAVIRSLIHEAACRAAQGKGSQ